MFGFLMMGILMLGKSFLISKSLTANGTFVAFLLLLLGLDQSCVRLMPGIVRAMLVKSVLCVEHTITSTTVGGQRLIVEISSTAIATLVLNFVSLVPDVSKLGCDVLKNLVAFAAIAMFCYLLVSAQDRKIWEPLGTAIAFGMSAKTLVVNVFGFL